MSSNPRSRSRNPAASAPPSKPGVTVRKAPFPIALVLLLTAVTLTILSVYVPDLIHVTELSPGPTHFETKYGLYRRCTRKTPVKSTFWSSNAEGSSSPTVNTFVNQLMSPLSPSQDSVYILERSHPSDHESPSSLERLTSILRSTQAIAYRQREAVQFETAVGTQGLEDTPIDGEGDGWLCTPFPQNSECERFGQKFCILWSTAGYAAQLALAPCVVALIALLVITVGIGSRKVRARRRRGGWKIVSILMAVHAVLQTVSIAIILHIYRTDFRFRGLKSHLDKACDFAVASAVISYGTVIALTLTGVAAEAGKTWAAGKSAKQRAGFKKYHRRTRSGRVVEMPVTEDEERPADEQTSLLP
ncbi:hypothetical protein NliqN6_3454 [Naganishia liquefaciens]|uniref:Uncharacterized protein n=1 Tax=Naganishia liquefaciens TaxID=104408 RepID=A0A8H3TTU1_9TREE|nr:hypothetical protein NliqN6_3454 [Naganishia liquefaciens]